MLNTAIKPEQENAFEKRFPIPAYIEACARAIRYDLFHGPSWALIPGGDIENFTPDYFATYRADLEEIEKPGDIIEETYVGQVAQALRGFIAELPAQIWLDTNCDEILDKEPEGYLDDETGEYVEPFWEDYRVYDSADIVAELFGKTIAKEFS